MNRVEVGIGMRYVGAIYIKLRVRKAIKLTFLLI